MAAGALGSLVVTLGLDAAQFTAGLTKSEFDAKKWRDQVSQYAEDLGVKIGAGAAIAGAALFALTKSAIDSADAMSKLASASGTTTEELSALSFAADLSGVNSQQLGETLSKLAKAINDTSKGTGAQVEAFKALGISVTDSNGNLKSTVSVLTEIADRFAGYEDSIEKTVLAQALFGETGARLIPLLNNGAEGLKAIADEAEAFGLIVKTDTSKAAEQFNDTLTKLGAAARGFGNQAAEALLPTLQAVADELLNTAKSAGTADSAIAGLKLVFETLSALAVNTKFVLESTGREIGAILAQLSLVYDLLRTPPSEFLAKARSNWRQFNAISEAAKADADLARKQVDEATARILNPQLRNQAPAVAQPPRPRAPRLPTATTGGAGASAATAAANEAEQLARKQLEGQLKAVREFATDQRDAISFATQFARSAYEEGTTALRDQLAIQTALRQESLRVTVRAFDEELAALESYRSKVTKPTERADLEARITDVVVKRQQAVTRAAQQGVIDAQAEARALADLERRYQDLRISVLQLSGDERGAAAITIQRQVEEARRLLTQAGRDPAEAERFGVLLTQTADLRNLQQDYNRLLDQQRLAEENILLTAQESGATELETLAAVRDSRQQAITQMADMVRQAQELAAALGTPEAQRFAEQLALNFRKATNEIDPLLQRVKDVSKEMGDSIARSFENAIVSGGSLKDMLGGIAQDILRITTQQLITKPLANFLTGAIGSSLGGIFGGGKALGGPVAAGGLYRVAENRPEMLTVNGESFLMMGNQRGNINPNPSMARGGQAMNANITVNMPQGTTVETANQAGVVIARRLRAATLRNQ